MIAVLALIILIGAVPVTVLLWRAGTWGRAMLAALAVAFGWIVFRAVEPEPAFYVELFERETGVNFPNSARFLDRSASYPDNTGDFCASAVVEIDSADAARLRRALHRERLASRVEVGEPTPVGWCGASARGPFEGVLRDSKDGRALWWGLSEEGHLVFQYAQM